MPRHYRLKGQSLEAIQRKAEEQYGAGARIVAAEKVTSPGIGGLFAANRFEATVEVPEPAQWPPVTRPVERPTPAAGSAADAHRGLRRPAIADLLAEADRDELRIHRSAGPAAQVSSDVVSTTGEDFAGLLEQLGTEYGTPAPAVGSSPSLTVAGQRRAPAPLTGTGDLVLLLGLGDDALGPALAMSIAAGGCDVRTGGSLSAFGHLHISDRQGATAARARAVMAGQAVVLAFGLGRPRDVHGHRALISSLGADQVWVVADARRKPEDTAAWLVDLTGNLAVDALAVVGSEDTLSPGTVNGLGLPVGWHDSGKVD